MEYRLEKIGKSSFDGDMKIKSSNGDVSIETAASLDERCSDGDITLMEK